MRVVASTGEKSAVTMSFSTRRPKMARRTLLSAGAVAGLGLSWPAILHAGDERRASGAASAGAARAKNVLLVYLFGGPSHIDMWDMKPDGPSATRGEFAPIASTAPGLPVCEHLPRLARVLDRTSLIRSVHHDRTVHGGAVGFVLTGTRTGDPGIPGVRGPDASPGDHPALGATVNRFAPARPGVPTTIALPWDMTDGQGRKPPGQGAGFLGRKYDPWLAEGDPNKPGFGISGLRLQSGLTVERLAARGELLAAIDEQRRELELPGGEIDAYYGQAVELLSSSRTHAAFDIEQEPAALRDRYGRNTFGQSCLLARRLVESGVRFVQVNMGNRLFGDYGWDTHSQNFKQHKKALLPKFDPGLSTLLVDLEERGLLDETLVVCMGEFGRSPAISKDGGRDHWPQCYTVLLAGAGAKRGFVLGRSDAQGAYPVEDPVTPEELVATVYDALGIDPAQLITDPLGREHRLVLGKPLAAIWA